MLFSSDAVCVCHLDGSATEIQSLQEIYGAEWRDPEALSLAMLSQGVLSVHCPASSVFATSTAHHEEAIFPLG